MFLSHYSFLTSGRIFSSHICWIALLLVVFSGCSEPAATPVTESSKSVRIQKSSNALSPELPPETELMLISLETAPAKPLLAPFDQRAAKAAQQSWADSMHLEPVTTNGIGMQFALIPPGEFMMGSPANEVERQDFEVQHRVKLTKPFYLGTYEVTQAEYKKIMGENPSWFSPQGRGSTKVTGQKTDRFPVDSASWFDAQIFCRKLSEREGKTYRLPTEAEWEYACRAGTTGPFHFGNVDNGRLSNTAGDDPYGTDVKGPTLGRTTPMGSYAPNAFGLFDMHGNVFEWCADWYVPPVYRQRTGKLTVDPLVSTKAPVFKTRVLRGGAWNKGKEIHARSALRRGNLPSWKGQNIGFRVVQEATQQARPAGIAQSLKPNDKQIKVIKDPRAGELVFIPAGTFLMGAPANEKGAWPFEKPQHKVEIKTGFYIGKYEVTHEQFRVFSAETGYKTEAQKNPRGGGGYDAKRKDVVNHHQRFSWRFPGFPQRSNEPVVNVTWNDAVAYCKWLTEKDGKYLYRLPTEAEWEYVGRAGTKTAYAWGQDENSLIGNENVSDQSLAKKLNPNSFHYKRCGKGDDGFTFTAPVGSFKPNAFGIYDLHGNVSEWCEDVYLENRYQNPDRPFPKTGAKRVLRGGSYLYLHLDCRSARRVNALANERRCDRGFRIVREAAPRPAAQSVAEAKPQPVPATPTPTTPPVIMERDVISFQPLPTDEPVTSFTVTEDNRFLICSHQGANQVSVWDALTKAKVAVLSTTSPRSVMSRGDQLFVANDGEGTISVYSRDNKWALTNQLDVEKPHIVYLSAPQEKFFKGEILVTCHGKGNKASYEDCHIYHLNVKDDRDKHISKSALATCSYDGRIVITQGSFNLSSAGGISAFAWDDFISSESPYPIYKGGIPQTPYAYQVHPGSIWLANNNILGGVPLTSIKLNLGKILIADRNQKLVYSVTENKVRAHILNALVEEIGDRKVVYPKNEFGLNYNDIYRTRDYLLDHPIAFTADKTTHFFVLDLKKNLLLSATTPAFPLPERKLVGQPDSPLAEDSQPDLLPARIAEGEAFRHQLPDNEGTSYVLMSGPKGLRLEKNLVTWKPGVNSVGTHELKFKVTQDNQVSFVRIDLEVVSRELVERAGSLENIDRFTRLPLEIDLFKVIPTSDYQSVLLLQGDSVKRLSGNGIQVAQEYRLPHRYHFLAERDNTFLALNQSEKQLDLIDQKTLKVTRSIPLRSSGIMVMEITDLAVHPQLPISYVAVKTGLELPRYQVLVVNEKSRKVSAPDELLGTWVCVDPAGKMLYTGYGDMYRRGTRFHINPGWRLLEVPQYGNIDFLITCNLRNGFPRVRQYIPKAGANGSGIRLSPDGKRITYLSFGGFPPLSKNLPAWNPTNLKKEPVIYEIKDRAVTNLLAYHPTLNLVAVPGGNSAVLFDRETGREINDKLLFTKDGLGEAKVDDLFFSPDGTSLVFLCNEKLKGRYLRSVPLKLNSLEKSKISQGVKRVVPQPLIARSRETVKKSEIQSLNAARKGKKLSAQEIASQFNQSVLLIQTEEGSASGFVVGQKGYILTCAHAIPSEGKINISYLSEKTRSKTKREAEVELVHIDEDLDLALLKMKGNLSLKPVALGERTAVDSGEQVTVIGNPSVGETILSQTLTTGVVSNPKRLLRGQSLIQISAAVNPGNSGGPVFDEFGHVIGLVVLKADIEATGFAVPVTQLRAFLLEVTNRKTSRD